jgi:CubicO group peptidase (beta-lactamase class C family)
LTKRKAFETRFQRYLEAQGGLKSFTEGLQILALHKGRSVYRQDFGKTYLYYDLASLTKILFTTSIIMKLVEQKRFSLRAPITRLWPEFQGKAQVFHLLTHQAGLDWWRPFYKQLDPTTSVPERWLELEKLLISKKTKVLKKSVYSDLDLLTLGVLLMKTQKASLLELFEETQSVFRLRDVFFNVGNRPRYARSLYAPTENCSWRGKVLRGEVHDENAWSLGGVAPHAGLFGTLDGVASYLQLLRKCYRGESRVLRSATVKQFTRRKMNAKDGDFGYGFMLPTHGRASCGSRFSSRSFGHTGFTGTSLWYDPQNDFGVVILSNRVHPTRENRRFLDLRPLIHDWLFESFVEGGSP